MHSSLNLSYYLLKRQVLALTGTFRLYDEHERLVLFSQQKMMRLKEDIRIYDGEERAQELLHIQARKIIDFSAAYDVYDVLENRLVGSLRRKGWRSLARDEWEVLDSSGVQIGVLIEDDLGLALLRRFLLGTLLPQNYDLLVDGVRAADLRQLFHFLRYVLELDMRMDASRRLDPRLGIAASILLAAIEGKQD